MSGNNPIFWLKLHILVNISVNSWQIGMKPLWTRNNFLRQSKWGVATPMFWLKLHILVNISVNSRRIDMKPLWTRNKFFETVEMRGNNPMFWLELHILVNNSVNSWWSGTKPSWTRVKFFETVKMRGNNPLKWHILVNISANFWHILHQIYTRLNFMRQSRWGPGNHVLTDFHQSVGYSLLITLFF